MLQIIYNEFPQASFTQPTPAHQSIDPEVIAASPPSRLSLPPSRDLSESLDPSSQSSAINNKENTAPPQDNASRPAVPPFSVSQDTTSLQQPDLQVGTLPPELSYIIENTTNTLQKTFAQSPPHTIQRFAELVLYPRKHYRFLPPYLAALDRVVSVSSPVSDFPLPQLQLSGAGAGFLTNGDTATNGITEREGLGSDESLGGALLTPIPWLRRDNGNTSTVSTSQNEGELRSEGSETIEGPNGAGRIETVSVTINGVPSAAQHRNGNGANGDIGEGSAQTEDGEAQMTTEQALRAEGAVTQGELLRQEQEAGVVPVAQTQSRRPLSMNGPGAGGRDPLMQSVEETEKPEEHAHARGPDVIGMEDMGPQEGMLGVTRPLDMEAAVGRSRSKSPQPPDHPDDVEAARAQADGDKVNEHDAEGDTVIGDAEDPASGTEAKAHHRVDEQMGGTSD